MGLRATLDGVVTSIFSAIGDIPETSTYRRIASAYVPATGVTTLVNTDYTLSKVVWTRFESFEVDKQTVLASDVKVIFQTSKLAIVPNIATDKVVRADGKIYNLLRVMHDPAGVTTTLQLRAPSQ